jgi:hypothetical protein
MGGAAHGGRCPDPTIRVPTGDSTRPVAVVGESGSAGTPGVVGSSHRRAHLGETLNHRDSVHSSMGRSPSAFTGTDVETPRFSSSGTDPSSVADAVEATIDERVRADHHP